MGALRFSRWARQADCCAMWWRRRRLEGYGQWGMRSPTRRVLWAVALLCGVAALLTPFLMVVWCYMMSLQEATLGWVCTWHTHPASIDLQQWQARAVTTCLSWPLPAANVTSTQWWERALS